MKLTYSAKNPGPAFKACLLAVITIMAAACARPPEPVRNLLFICIDTVRYDVFTRLGEVQPDRLNPFMDQAVVFEDASSAAPWTAPSLATVFSGLWPPQHGVGMFPSPVARLDQQIPSGMFDDVPVFAQALEAAGIENTVISAHPMTDGKISPLGLDRGVSTTRNFPARWRQMVGHYGSLLQDRAGADSKSRHYDYLHFMEAHNWHIEDVAELDRRIEALKAGTIEIFIDAGPPGVCEVSTDMICKRYLVYASAVAELRKAIAATLRLMRDQQLLDDTVVVLMSDHGEEFGDHANDPRIRQTSEVVAYIGHSHSLYQELIQVPLVVWHPRIGARRVTEPVSLIDIAPSLARWLGVEFEPDLWGGRHLDQAIAGGDGEKRVIYATGIAYGEQQIATREGNRKSIWHTVSDQTDYFDLAQDPRELHDAKSEEWVWYFDSLLSDFLALMPTGKIEPASLSKEQIRRLQAIGYLQGVEAED